MTHKKLFWLHIKKSAGISTRSLLQPFYIEVDREKKPKTFIQASPEEYNDILNNYRVVLGEYQFKRCLFAKKYLYSKEWDDMFSFAFSRAPLDRCVSMFYYLFWKDSGVLNNSIRSITKYGKHKKVLYNTSYAFDVFLDYITASQSSDSIYYPLGNHFTTHTAAMWDDITDMDGKVLIKKVYRLENLITGINSAFEECGIDKRIDNIDTKLNKNMKRRNYSPKPYQKKKIENLYYNDFELYEKS